MVVGYIAADTGPAAAAAGIVASEVVAVVAAAAAAAIEHTDNREILTPTFRIGRDRSGAIVALAVAVVLVVIEKDCWSVDFRKMDLENYQEVAVTGTAGLLIVVSVEMRLVVAVVIQMG